MPLCQARIPDGSADMADNLPLQRPQPWKNNAHFLHGM
jgi:hypothetical protein